MIFKKILKQKLFLLLGDILIIILSTNLAYIIRLKTSIISYLGLNDAITTILLMLTIYIISFYIFDLYNIRLKSKSIRFVSLVLGSLILASLITAVFFYFFPFKLGRGVFFISLVLIGILITIWRMFYSDFFRFAVPPRKVLIVGPKKKAKAVFSILKTHPEYELIGLIDDKLKKIEFSKEGVLLDSLSLENIVNNYKIDDIIVTIDTTRKVELSKNLVNCKMKGINIYDIPTLYEAFLDKLPVSYIKPKWLLYSDGFGKLGNKIYKRIKRGIDLLISSILLIISTPVGIIIFLAIKLTSKGPIFIKQERVGENHKHFNLIKFRTMVANAESGDPIWAKENDHRITKIGNVLRKTRLDELPQLINVVKGEMSLTGPRPEREFFVKKLIQKIPFYSLRFSVKPGLTGWAQINYGYGASEKDALEKLQYDLYYVKNMSLLLDFGILLKTIRIVIFGMGR